MYIVIREWDDSIYVVMLIVLIQNVLYDIQDHENQDDPLVNQHLHLMYDVRLDRAFLCVCVFLFCCLFVWGLFRCFREKAQLETGY